LESLLRNDDKGVESDEGKTRTVLGESAAGSLIERDPQSGRTFLRLPLPPAKILEKLAGLLARSEIN
jgi:hypothetical protein